jgi:serine/threonine-protein kinase HipA
MSTVAEVKLWGSRIGAIALEDDAEVATFQYDPDFLHSNIELAPLTMPLSTRLYSFPGLASQTFHGLPGLLADSLPDKFGNAIIDSWLSGQGRKLNPVERLCYTGTRGMGALEFSPAAGPTLRQPSKIYIDKLVALASDILSRRHELKTSFQESHKEDAARDILRVGTSAGGARAKAIIAWNPATNDVRSGQIEAGSGYEYWLLKFDGVRGNKDKELDDPKGYGAIEYAYSMMATEAGIQMSKCRLFEEGGRRHFMTRRFDRTDDGARLHMQSLGAMAHYDYNLPGAHSYEQAFAVMKKLHLPMHSLEEQFRRMVFNVVARNQDDHVKNIAFLMDKAGQWSLSPAFDITYSYQPDGAWTARHQMTINGKSDDFTRLDFQTCARVASLKRGRDKTIINEVEGAVAKWRNFADEAGVSPAHHDKIQTALRLPIDP